MGGRIAHIYKRKRKDLPWLAMVVVNYSLGSPLTQDQSPSRIPARPSFATGMGWEVDPFHRTFQDSKDSKYTNLTPPQEKKETWNPRNGDLDGRCVFLC